MRALDRKLLRDFRRLWAQALAIALVLACGVAVILMSFGMSTALDETRAAYYERNRFAHVFAQARRAPLTLLPEIEAIPGVAAAETRITSHAILDLPGRVKPAVGRILSLPEAGLPRLNVPILRSGSWPGSDSTDAVVVNEPFAQANGYRIGDGFWANLDGHRRWLTITGTALSPEFIYTIGPGALMPDNEGYGILWMPAQSAAATFDMTGAFNDLSLSLRKDARPEPVLEAVDDLLRPFGGLGAHGRDLQVSNAFLDAEITQLKALAYILPPVFLGITVFLVNMVIGRIIALERSQIGLLKAIGYSDAEVSLHYILLAALIAAAGVGIGWAGGSWLARALARIYAEFYEFPYLIYRMPLETYLVSGLLGFAAAVTGAVQSALAAARMAPAVAMSPPAPPRFRTTIVDRILRALRLSQPTMMILRDILRWPLRAAFSALGLALATSVLVAANFFDDAFDEMVDVAFYQSNRQDAMLLFSADMPLTALEEVRRLPGVLQAEPQQFHAAILRNGHRSKRVSVEARLPGADLSRVVDAQGTVLTPRPGTILLASRLAGQLDLAAGDAVTVEFLGGRRETVTLPVGGISQQLIGIGAYLDLETADALFRRSPRTSVVNVTLDQNEVEAFQRAIKDIPRLSGSIFMTENLQSFTETIDQNQSVMISVYATLGLVITVGVAYNAARVQLSERARELASLRILGFGRGEVAYILIGEVMLLALLAQPLGWWIGAMIARLMTRQFSSDLYVIPLVLEPSTFTYASLVVLAATAGSLLLVRRRLDRLDLVAVMKTRE